MIGRSNRFHGYGSLRYFYRNGKTVRGALFGLRYQLNSRRRQYRIAVVVSKKVHKSAVVRNRIRRRLYEIVRQLQPPINHPYDLVITVYSENVATAPQEQLIEQLTGLLEQANIVSRDTIETNQKEL